jgi:signal transduction histidine kinase
VVVREDDRLVIRAVAGYGALPLGGLSFPMEALGLPVESLPAQIADFAERSQKYLPPEVSAFLHTLPQTQATLFLPLQGKETFHGLLAVSSTQRPDAFDADGRQILDLFAHQAAIAIENARLFSELQSSLEEVQRQARELTRGQEELQGLIAAVSQRIQGPVEALAGFARLLKDGAAARLTDEESDYLDRIERNSRYMSRLTQDMLFLSRLDQVGEEREPITLTTLVRGVGTHLELERQKITLSVQEGMPVVYADPVLTWTLFRNLLQNARRLLGEAEDPRIEVSCQVEDGTYHLSVRGNGEALSPEGLERIFDLFAPLGKSGADGPEIGLTVARRILQRYNGRVWAAAEAGRGTSFHVAFPIELGQQ